VTRCFSEVLVLTQYECGMTTKELIYTWVALRATPKNLKHQAGERPLVHGKNDYSGTGQSSGGQQGVG
jgi:hypothetical protein